MRETHPTYGCRTLAQVVDLLRWEKKVSFSINVNAKKPKRTKKRTMSRQKLRILKTDLNNLISNVRGEVGEIISSWVLMRSLMAKANDFQTNDVERDIQNEDLTIINILVNKLRDEIVARLSELAEMKVGQLTFCFVQEKLGQLKKEVSEFDGFINCKKFREKRNYNISHKQLPEQWSDHKHIHIPYISIIKGIALALRLMKKIDRNVLGPSAPYLWREMRKRRYMPMSLSNKSYMLLPYLRLSEKDREEIIFQEMTEGKQVWVDMETKIDDVKMTVKACKQWGALLLDNRMILLNEYPLQKLGSINTKTS